MRPVDQEKYDPEENVHLLEKKSPSFALLEDLKHKYGSSKTVVAGACFCMASGGMVCHLMRLYCHFVVRQVVEIHDRLNSFQNTLADLAQQGSTFKFRLQSSRFPSLLSMRLKRYSSQNLRSNETYQSGTLQLEDSASMVPS